MILDRIEPRGFPSIVAALRARAADSPDRFAFIFLKDGAVETARLTYSQLDREARAVAALLQSRQAAGERVLLLFPPGLGFIVAFFGCLYAGAVAVPLPPPRARGPAERLRAVLADSHAAFALATATMAERLEELAHGQPSLQALRCFVTDELDPEQVESWTEPAITDQSLAFLQYTSGSLAEPKGVMVSHGGLIRNQEMIRQGFGQSDRSVVVGWLPPYHDMGLIGNILQPLFVGGRCVLMSPGAFLQRPFRWLEAITRYRATTSGGPNFAYELCVERITPDQRRELDLSSWSVAFNGSEPVRATTLERFAEAFESCGFRPEAFYPCYGLAEATVFVTGPRKDALPVVESFRAEDVLDHRALADQREEADVRKLVGCGHCWCGLRLAIVDPERHTRCPEGQIGEIWLAGESVTLGYWRQPEKTAAVFGARCVEDPGVRFLRTGDLGFVHSGELFVTGRLKELIVIRGRNHYPHDIELTAESCHPALKPGCGAAFSVDLEGEEQVVVVQEIDRRWRRSSRHVAAAVRLAVTAEHGVPVRDVLIAAPGTVPKTSSGKIQRRRCRAAYLKGEIRALDRSRFQADPDAGSDGGLERETLLALRSDARRQALEAYLRAQVARATSVDLADWDLASGPTPAGLGLDSLTSIQLKDRLERSLGVSVELSWLLAEPSLERIAELVLEQFERAPRSRSSLIPARSDGEAFPLSHGQRGLWVHHRMAPDSSAYNIAGAVEVRGPLDLDSLRLAFVELTRRHESLRMAFEEADGRPCQRRLESFEIDFRSHDAVGWEEGRLRGALKTASHRPFDLAVDIPFRVRVFATGAEEHVLLLVVHHISADFWSLALLVSELEELYRRPAGGEATRLAPARFRYRDYVDWQEQVLSGPRGQELWEYWRKQLQGAPLDLELPIDRPRPRVQTYRGASLVSVLHRELTESIESLRGVTETTLFMVLLAAFQTLLYRYTGQTDLLIGCPVAGRTRKELARVVGYFVNPIVVRADLTAHPSFEELLRSVKRTVTAGLDHQEFPFPLLAERLQPVRGASRPLVFQVMFILQNMEQGEQEQLRSLALGESGARFRLADLELESLRLPEERTAFELTLMAAEVRGTLRTAFQYNADLFEATTVRRMLRHLREVVAAAASRPDTGIGELPMIGRGERSQLLTEWNATGSADFRDHGVHHLVERTAASCPDRVAVVMGRRSATYGHLERRVAELAEELRGLGIGPEAPVAVSAERSFEMVAGLLAILRAGGAFLPIDPRYPRHRRRFMLEDSGARWLLVGEEGADDLADVGALVLPLSSRGRALRPPLQPSTRTRAENIAYVIYTSGSTGQPKGVQIAHGAVVNFLRSMARQPGLGPDDVLVSVTTLSFDIAVLEIFLPLTVGARLVLANAGEAASGARLLELLNRSGATAMQATPATWQLLLDAGWQGGTVKALCGGEALPPELAARLAARSASLWNLYGPTETTIWSTVDRWLGGNGAVSIGRPIANTGVVLLDRRDLAVPLGIAGMLHIGGRGLSRGYLGEPRKTAASFVPDPIWGEKGSRLYRTGDLARYRADGRLVFLGRVDHQVKLRGFRIELGEIESALDRHPAIRRAVVVARHDLPGGPHLVAYAEPAASARPESDELRRFLAERLPHYMMPGFFVVLDALPLTANGKVDRRALPSPRQSAAGRDLVAPRNAFEEMVADIWSATLGVERVGVGDDFFNLGGHSLLAARVASRLEDAFQLRLPLTRLFENPVLADLAGAIQSALHEGAAPLPPLVKMPREGPVPLSFAQQRLWFLNRLEPEGSAYNIPAAVQIAGRLRREVLERSLEEVVKRHEALRTVFRAEGGRPVQATVPALSLRLPFVDLSRLAAGPAAAQARLLTWRANVRPFDLSRGPLLRALLLRLRDEDHILSATMHHIVSDGWSMGVLVHELGRLYAAFSAGRPSPLPPLPVQYPDFALWQRRWLSGAEIERQLAYWVDRLADLPDLELASDRPRSEVRASVGGRRRVALGRELTSALSAASQRRGVTVFMWLLGVLQVLAHRYSRQRDFAVGSPVANRRRAELEEVIGFFANTMVLRADLTGSPSFAEILGRVREAALSAYAHQDLPFEVLVEKLKPERHLDRNPLFQIAFALQNVPIPELTLPGLKVRTQDAESGGAIFDLRLDLREEEGELRGFFEYHAGLFDATTVERLAKQFQTLLRGTLEAPGSPLPELPWLSGAERHVLVEHRGRRDAGTGRCLHELFQGRAAAAPEDVAVVFGEETLSYRQLNSSANRLMHLLRAFGVRPGDRVGLLSERSPEMLVGLLGILKAGAAYVPLDPAYPADRIAYMTRDAGLSLLVTQEGRGRAMPGLDVPAIELDRRWRALAGQSSADPEPELSPLLTAYVIYTSGSTGRPKGVEVTHANVTRLFDATRELFDFGRDDVWTLFHSIAFDFSVWEIWGPWLHGGRLVVVPYEVSRSPAAFFEMLRETRVTVLNQTPSAFRQLIAAEEAAGVAGELELRYVIFGGEALELRSLGPWFERHGDEVPRLVNMYGITETTVHVTHRLLGKGDLALWGSVIGYPIPDLEVSVLDSHLRPVSCGVPGELHVGGAGVAPGYLGRAGLTAGRFVPNPFGALPGDRLYRTGDLGRRLVTTGELQYAGRIDQQVKLRGFRIELGEIEVVMSEHSGVRESAVVLRSDDGSDPRLVGYVVPERSFRGTEVRAGAVDGAGEQRASRWQEVFDDVYSRPADPSDPAFDISGWHSSYTGQPIPAEEMREWVECTVARIRSLRPRRTLEIGAGTGLLVSRLAPSCESYWATDFSPRAVRRLRRLAATLGLSRIHLERREANDFEGLPKQAFDCVVINSVAQYFPGVDYLLGVLEGAVDLVRPGGFVFLGDLRSLPLLEPFHVAVELRRAPRALPLAQLRQRVQARLLEEDELVLAPALFTALAETVPRVGGVRVQPRWGRFLNELTRFRYDAVLEIEPEAGTAAEFPWLDWRERELSLEEVRRLARAAPARLGFAGVPNARVAAEVRAAGLLNDPGAPPTAGELRRKLAASPDPGIDPEDFRALGAELSYDVHLSWLDGGSDGSYDVVLTRGVDASWPRFPGETGRRKPWAAYATDPLRGTAVRGLIPELRELLRGKLPVHMVPAAFVSLARLPLTAHGKLDRRLLPAPDPDRPRLEISYAAPETTVEKSLAELFSAVLGVERVGIHDDFFDLGGHSLLATQLVSRARDVFGVELPLRRLFERPTVARLAELLDRDKAGGGEKAPALVALPRGEDLPLSFAQQRLWFLEQLRPGAPTYNVPACLHLEGGELDLPALTGSLNELVRRHEVLRTSFPAVAGRPRQEIAATATVAPVVVDLTGLAGDEGRREGRRLIQREARRPFALEIGPLFTVQLIRFSDREHALLLVVHHIVADGWSIGVLVRELEALYEAFSRRRPSPLPELPIQYAEYAAWQREWLRGDVLASQLSFWRQRLADLPSLDLPADRPRPAVRGDRGAVRAFRLEPALTRRLAGLASSSEATLFMILLAAFKVELHRYSGQQDLAVGSPIANRRRTELEGLIGFFVNTLILRTDLRGTASFGDLLERVRDSTVAAYAHQDVPFEKLVEELQPERYQSHQPLFQVIFALQNAPMPALRLTGLELSRWPVASGTAKFDVTVSLEEAVGGLDGWVEYSLDLFDATTIERVIGQYRVLLDAIARNPEARVTELPLLGPGARHQLVVEWPGNEAGYPRHLGVHEVFEVLAETMPDASAVEFGDQVVGYAELNRRSNQLAHYLASLGVGDEAPVGVCLERSVEMIVAFVGILKAGGAYVPLDPSYPEERLASIVEDSAVSVVLTQRNLLSVLPRNGSRFIDLSAAPREVGGEPEHNPGRAVEPEALAYVVYTSGSTGRPKGVAVGHRAVNRLVLETDYVRLAPSNRVAQVSSSSFDAATFEIWGALLSGATLVGITKEVALSPQQFAQELAERRIDVLFLTTALLNLVAGEAPDAFRNLEDLLFGGQAVDPGWCREILAKGPPRRLLHVYGPTESTTYSSWHRFERVPEGATTIPIGRPIANTELYVLDRGFGPAPIGVPRQLYIGGDGLARGYLANPRGTAERFLPDPFVRRAGGRLYDTGDLVRYLTSGDVEFIGRVDDQVKIRGFRVEPGEIAAVLGEHPAVHESVVVTREDQPGELRLVAYAVLCKPLERPAEELRRFLKKKLPEYMVPAGFVALPALPLTPSGKIDRWSLPAPEYGRVESDAGWTGPRTVLEEQLCELWAELLDLDRLGIHDDFFELGGHSLLGTQLVSRIRETFGVELALRSLFEEPTVAGIAGVLATQLEQGRAREAPPIEPSGERGYPPLSFAQERLWFLHQLDPSSTAYHLATALELRGELKVAALRRSLSEIRGRHQTLRTTFAVVDGTPVQVVAPVVPLPLPVVDLSRLAPEAGAAESRALLSAEARRPFDLAAGPLVRSLLVRLGRNVHVLSLFLHHVISDGWSLGIFTRELATIYGAFWRGTASPLPEPPVQYADFARWQRRWLREEVLADELSYWRLRLSAAPPVLELPTDRPRPAVRSFRGGRLSIPVPRSIVEAAGDFCRRENVTLYMALLSTFGQLLARYSRQEDLAVGTPTAGRHRLEIEGLIGFFVNTLVLRMELGGDPSPRELLARVKETAIQAYSHQDLPFAKLVEGLQPERNLQYTPLFQVLFSLQSDPTVAPELPGLATDYLGIDRQATQVDLNLMVERRERDAVATFEYSDDLFDRGTVLRMGAHFVHLLAAMTAAPEVPWSRRPMLSPKELHQIVVEINATGTGYRRGVCLHQLVEEQAARSPEAVSHQLEDRQQLTYGELDRRANRLARRLRNLGVGPDVPVGLCAERSLEMVVGLLGILKAGGAYLPLDPEFPRARLAFMIGEAEVPVLLTVERLAGRLPEHQATVLLLDAVREAPADRAETDEAAATSEGNLCYVIYTSGSTGRPKGVGVCHAAICNRLLWMQEAYGLTPGDRVLQKTPFTFDVSVWELFWPLITGAKLVLARPGGHRDGAQLAHLTAAHGITTLHFVPSMLQAFLDETEGEDCRSLVRVVCSGEALTRDLQDRFHRCLGAELHNLYGPTEAAVDVTFWPCAADAPPGPVPLGWPIANLGIHVLDGRLTPTGLGIPGELHICGIGLARGYVRRPALSAERFIPDPFGPPGTRLYKSGDLARVRADGTREFLGRIDHQVKLRGFRIELGEIEKVLSIHSGLRQVVVTTRASRAGDDRLVAYLVPSRSRPAPSVDELRDLASESLPTYMVPSAFVVLDELPLGPSGKLDRRALPEPEDLPESCLDPRTPVEQVMAILWSEVLGLERVGIDDDFFRLGGHSLIATRLLSRVGKTFGATSPVRLLFENPTIREFAARVEETLRQGDLPGLPTIEALPRPLVDVPLSFAQERLWFLDQLESGSAVYNLPVRVDIDGALDYALLRRSLNEIVRRHEALRASFPSAQGKARQVVAASRPCPLPVVDLSKLSQAESDRRARSLAVEEARRPFDLSRGPLLRVLALRLHAGRHRIVLNVHHIVSDGWSMGILVQEIVAIYGALVERRPASLPELPIQFPDFGVWQRRWLTGQTRDRQLEYWKGQLAASAVPLLELPLDRPRSAFQTSAGGSLSVPVEAGVAEGLRRLSRRQRSTVFITGLAVLQSLLSRVSGQTDIWVGTPVAGRSQLEIEGLIGFFVNTLVLRGDLSGDPTFRDLVAAARELVLEAHAHQDLPFGQLVDELQPERSLSRSPLFQVMFAVPDMLRGALTLPGMEIRSVCSIDTGTAKFDLSLDLEETGADGFRATMEYSRDLFDATTIHRLLCCFRQLMTGVTEDGDRRLSELPLLTRAQLHQILVGWNHTAAVASANLVIHELFEARAKEKPESIAVSSGDERVTYGDLDRRGNQLAHFLRDRGVGPEARVGILLERSPDLVVAVMAVLKAGGAYVPLDPNHPDERLAFFARDARLQAVLTQAELAPLLPDEVPVVFPERGAYRRLPDGPPPLTARPGNLAYCIYTSGSTGRPKGVMISHRSLLNAYLAWEEIYRLRVEVRCHLQMASFSFDVFTGDLVRALCSGGRLVLCPPELLLEPAELFRLMAAERVEAAEFVPAVLRGLISQTDEASLSLDFMRVLVVGSDLWYGRDLERLGRSCGHETRLINTYGITETTIDSTFFEGEAIQRAREGGVPIGRPFANTQLFVLSPDFRPVPMGSPGELHIGGSGPSRGYLARPALTASRFIPDPHGGPGTRLYRAGDLVRYLPDGNLEYLGRSDNQVKIRGFRIELGEIEAALAQHSGIGAAVVLGREVRAGDKRLVAYTVASDPRCPPSVEELRAELQERLPHYMVPAAFVMLEAFPLSANGKVDRRALPAPRLGQLSGTDTAAQPPKTAEETVLAEIWERVLAVEKVRGGDNFFALGGDSILSLQVVAAAKKAGLQITPRQIFQHQTLVELAKVAEPAGRTTLATEVPAGPVPLTPIQRELFELVDRDLHHHNQAFLLEVRGRLDVSRLGEVFGRLVEHHQALRFRFERREGDWRQRCAEPHPVPVARIHLGGLSGSVRRAALERTSARLQAGLNLEEGPLIRVALFDFGRGANDRLLIVIHHLVVDGVSWRILFEDLQTGYQQLSGGEKIELPARTTSFGAWARRLAEHARTGAFDHELEYWLAEPAQKVVRLPPDHPQGDNTAGSTRVVSLVLEADRTEALLRRVPSAYGTRIDEVLLTALVEACARLTGARCLTVDLEGHGREEILDDVNLSRTVGWFTCTSPRQLDLTRVGRLGNALKAVKEQCRRVPNNGLGHGVLRYLSTPTESHARLRERPRAEISFNYLGQFDQQLAEASAFRPASESCGPTQGPCQRRAYLLEIDGGIHGGHLRLDWTYSAGLHERSTIERLAEYFLSALGELIDHCCAVDRRAYTPSDFPMADLEQKALDRLTAAGHDIEDVYPLTPMQQGLLFQSLYSPGAGAYVEQMICHLEGDFDVVAFVRTWQRIVGRHPVLRTFFFWEDLKEPVQVVSRDVAVTMVHLDWSRIPPEDQSRRFELYLAEDRFRGFDLGEPPLMRLSLIRLDAYRHRFVWTHHHLLLDGWSTPLILQEILAFYEAHRRGRFPELSAIRPYRDYVAWLQRQDLTAAEEYWRLELGDFRQPNFLGGHPPTASGPRPQKGFREIAIALSAAQTEALQVMARRHQLTISTLLQGAWAVWLSHTDGRGDVVFGTVVSGRPSEVGGIEEMIGLFINNLPVRIVVKPEAPLLGWLRDIQERQVEMRQFEYTPLARVQRWSGVPQGTPLFESVMAYDNYPMDKTLSETKGSLGVRHVEFESYADFPLSVVSGPDEEMPLKILYDPRRFSASKIRYILDELKALLIEFPLRAEERIETFTESLAELRRRHEAAEHSRLETVTQTKFRRIRRRTARI